MTAKSLIRIGDLELPAELQPPQSELQASFRVVGPAIVVDMELARPIARDMIKQARAPHWPRIDAARARAVEDGSDMAEVKARADRLRNAPSDPRIDAAKDPDALLDAVEAIKAEIGSL